MLFFMQTVTKPLGLMVLEQNLIRHAVREFFSSGKLLKQFNHTFFTLIPKSKSSTVMKNYRPIALCNMISQFLAKMLANRLQDITPELISDNQAAFVKGRHIHGNILLAHELVRSFNRASESLHQTGFEKSL